jgi:hypothetical protein
VVRALPPSTTTNHCDQPLVLHQAISNLASYRSQPWRPCFSVLFLSPAAPRASHQRLLPIHLAMFSGEYQHKPPCAQRGMLN